MKKLILLSLLFITLMGCSSSTTSGEISTPSFSSDSLITTSNVTTSESNITTSKETISSSEEKEVYHTATFINYNDEVLYVDDYVKDGEVPIYKGETPIRESTIDYTYTFSNWDKPLLPIKEDTTYKAVFTEEKIIYHTATFKNYDGEILYIDNYVKDGETPIYKGETPTKQGSYNKKYSFEGWDIYLEPIYQDTIYTAVFNEEEIYYTIYELNSFDGDYPIYYGQEVFLEDVGIVSVYSNNTFCVTQIHDPLDSYSIDVKALNDISETFTRGDIVTVIGTLDVINGRPFINNATVSWGYGGMNSCNNAAYIGTVQMKDREYWEEKISKVNSGNLYYSYMTIASIPEIKEGEDISFYVVFPGEDIQINENNFFLIEIRIPSLTSQEAIYASSWISQFKEGDGIYINFMAYYDNYMLGLLPFDILDSSSFNVPYTHKNVFSTYEGINNFINSKYPNYITVPSMENNYTYNYVTKTGYETIGNSTRSFTSVTFYTYQTQELVSLLVELYNSNEDYIYMGFEDEKHWISHPYSPGFDMLIYIFKAKGKVIFEMHLID